MRFIIFILLVVLFSFNVGALSVVSDYLEKSTLFLEDGTSKLYGIRLQNPSSDPINLQVTYDNTIVEIVDYEEIYTVPAKSSKALFFNITSTNFKPGETYKVSYTVHQLDGSGSGIPLLLKINKNFKVHVIQNPDRFYISNHYKYWPQSIIILIIVSYILLKNKKIRKNLFKKRNSKIFFTKRKIIKWKH